MVLGDAYLSSGGVIRATDGYNRIVKERHLAVLEHVATSSCSQNWGRWSGEGQTGSLSTKVGLAITRRSCYGECLISGWRNINIAQVIDTNVHVKAVVE